MTCLIELSRLFWVYLKFLFDLESMRFFFERSARALLSYGLGMARSMKGERP
jgi:hypothetical protein